jgi:cyclopropane fatty-acyl-phospholipid synthase-like methyltransferase
MSNSQDVIRQYYEEQYRERLGRRTRESLKRVHSNLRDMHIKCSDNVIDIGCGLGTVGLYLMERGAMTFGIDISFEAARAISQWGGYAAASQANAEILPFADLSFDGATFMGTLEHLLILSKLCVK